MATFSQKVFEALLKESSELAFREIVVAVKAKQCNLFIGAAVHATPPENHPLYTFPQEKLPPIGKGFEPV